MRLLLATALALSVAGAAGPAAAQDESLNRAREAFEKAQGHYEKGEFEKAAAEFERAYQARAFPQFLFNIGASYEKMKKYDEAVKYYTRFVGATKSAAEKASTQKRIEVLQKEIARLAAKPPDGGAPSEEPSKEVKALTEAKIRGLVVIETKPQGATIYLDKKGGKVLGKTPWNGSLERERTVYLEQEGYKSSEHVITPSNDRLFVLYVSMAEQDYLGFVEITSNIPESDIFVDDKSVGVFQKTPWKGNLPPGKHKIWITKEGYDEHFEEVNVVAGETATVTAALEGRPVGYVNVRGPETDRNKIYLDGKLLCERGPCRKPVPEGKHKISVRRSDHKSFDRSFDLQARTELTVYAKLEEEPPRTDAIIAYIVGAAFVGGGLFALDTAEGIRDEIADDIAAGTPSVSQEDGRFLEARIWSIAGHTALGLGAITGAFAIYYTFRDKGPPSTGTVDVKAVAIQPQVGPGYAGVGMGGSF